MRQLPLSSSAVAPFLSLSQIKSLLWRVPSGRPKGLDLYLTRCGGKRPPLERLKLHGCDEYHLDGVLDPEHVVFQSAVFPAQHGLDLQCSWPRVQSVTFVDSYTRNSVYSMPWALNTPSLQLIYSSHDVNIGAFEDSVMAILGDLNPAFLNSGRVTVTIRLPDLHRVALCREFWSSEHGPGGSASFERIMFEFSHLTCLPFMDADTDSSD